MNYFSICILLICILIIFSCAFFKSRKEGLTNSDNIILLGDSVINNTTYVPEGKSVIDVLKSKSPNVFSYAKDGATIADCYGQLDLVSLDLNKPNAYLFISAGGNDILNRRGQMDDAEVKKLFGQYMELIKAIRVKLTNAKINILNLYLPINPRYQSYKTSVELWNQMLQDASTKIGEMYNVIDLYRIMTSSNDFIYDIEPSETASEKIANAIYLTR
jgi:hypothetical protein